MNVLSLSIDKLALSELQTIFLTIQPRVFRHAKLYFRGVICAERRADCIAEAIALAWRWFLRLAERGKDARQFPSVLASFAVRAVRCGRRLCGQLRAKDVLSERAQQRHGFNIESLPSSTRTCFEEVYAGVRGQQRMDAFEERLKDNTQTPVPDQVQFRLDFPAWTKTRTRRDRRVIQDMSMGERTKCLAKKYKLSEGRISQMRSEFCQDWNAFTEA